METVHNIPVLMYHHVTNRGGFLDVSARQFERQIKWLAENGYTALSAEGFAAFLNGGATPKKSVVLTFDDGYLDNWVYAHPILKRYGMKAVLFVATGLIGTGAPRAHTGQGRALPLCPSHQQAKDKMFGNRRDEVMLRWSEIHAMVQAGTFEIHSHTHTHTRWDLICSSRDEKIERLSSDLDASRSALQEHLGSVSEHLCWPQGYFDDDYKRTAHQQGFRYLYTTDARGQNMPGTDPSHLYRFVVRDRSAFWLWRRMWVATHPVWGPVYNNWKKTRQK
ncbi:MAG TPA: polysaccharide deacetylase family protein [Burkholderiaceae bacterium]|nr:polysaccharide deacetylase family protein [Burkholderiaceae bacterium]